MHNYNKNNTIIVVFMQMCKVLFIMVNKKGKQDDKSFY